MTGDSIRDYADRQRERYGRARRSEKRRLLDEFVAVTGYHRKSAIRLLGGRSRGHTSGRRPGRPRQYGGPVAEAARVLWEAAGQIDAKRLQPFVPELLDRLLASEEIRVTPETDALLRRLSPATLHRLLAPARAGLPRRGRGLTRAATHLKQQIPIRTFADWDDAAPGYLEIDLVGHSGDSSEGFFLYTLTTVDVATSWVELEPVWGKGQLRVGAAIHQVRTRLPVPLRGLDSDGGSEFINHHLFAYCQRERIVFTRSRAAKKNDQAHVEQKNGAIVRHLVGYDRSTSRAAYAQLGALYRLVRLHTNYFQPVRKLVSKTRHGATERRTYDRAQTPYQRLVASGALDPAQAARLGPQYESLRPLQLRRQVDAALDRLWPLAARGPEPRPTDLPIALDAG